MAKEKEYLSIDYYTLKLNLEQACEIKKHLAFLLKEYPEITNEEICNYLLISGITDPILKEKLQQASLDNIYDAFDTMVEDMKRDSEALSGVCADSNGYEDAKKRLLEGDAISNDLRQLLLKDNAVLKSQIEKRIRERSENHQHSLENEDNQTSTYTADDLSPKTEESIARPTLKDDEMEI